MQKKRKKKEDAVESGSLLKWLWISLRQAESHAMCGWRLTIRHSTPAARAGLLESVLRPTHARAAFGNRDASKSVLTCESTGSSHLTSIEVGA